MQYTTTLATKPPMVKPSKHGPPVGKTIQRKRGGQSNNRNALRHGLKAGKLPRDAKYIEVRLNTFRRTLEQAVLAVKSEVNLTDAASIQTCLRWERHACLAQRWLVKAGDTLKPTDRLTFSREIARASAERDKAIASRQLGAKVERPWLALPAPDGEEAQ